MRGRWLAALAVLAAAGPAVAATPAQVLAATPADAWRIVADDRLMVLTLDDGGQALIELAPEAAPRHIANLRTLLAAHWFDGTAIVRVQENYVAQWGDPTERKPLPAGAAQKVAPEWDFDAAGARFDAIPGPDGYGEPGFIDGLPAARKGRRAWLVHCFGTVGVGRGEAPDSGNASELYAVIGHAPRNLDRNYTVIGRVVQGIEQLSARPRGTGPLGFYEKPEQRVGVRLARLASELPAAGRPRIEVLRSGTPTFAAYVAARANREDFRVPAGFVDLCNVRPPVRVAR